MPLRCTICDHPLRATDEELLVSRNSLANIARQCPELARDRYQALLQASPNNPRAGRVRELLRQLSAGQKTSQDF